MRRTRLRRKSLKPKKKVSLKETFISYGMPGYQKSWLRYKNPIEKGIFWYWFSRYIRLRDFLKYGRCISCDKPVNSWNDFDAGHYAPAMNCGFALLFDESNVNGECGGCNGFDSGHLIGYERGYVARYGENAMNILKERYFNKFQNVTKEWSRLEYVQKIAEYRAKTEKLELSTTT